eukprot:GHVS01107923.1.p1 GENE.GHVS01107923.1~~GHVS01107923.1.p1  ORF type:complete len:415 (+),score=55.26 GHVS01107923.1:324-1568(+)
MATALAVDDVGRVAEDEDANFFGRLNGLPLRGSGGSGGKGILSEISPALVVEDTEYDDELTGSTAGGPGTITFEGRLVGSNSRSSSSRGERRLFWIALILKILFVAIVVLFGVFSYTHAHLVGKWLEEYLNWARSTGPWSTVLFTTLYVGSTIFFMPAELLNVGGGFVFTALYGKPFGLYVAFICCELGLYGSSVACFSLSRYFLYTTVYSFCRRYPMCQAFSRAVEEGGTFFVALIRLSPVIPLTLTNYMFGLTTLRLRQLLLGTLTSIPLTCMFVWIGSELNDIRNLPSQGFKWTWENVCLVIFGIIMAVSALVYISVLTRRRLGQAYNAPLPESALLVHSSRSPSVSRPLADGFEASVSARRIRLGCGRRGEAEDEAADEEVGRWAKAEDRRRLADTGENVGEIERRLVSI